MERYEATLTAAYVRGVYQNTAKPLEELTVEEMADLIHRGEQGGLKMYHFKKKELLPRVRAVLGFLKGIQPESLLDVGSGRGVFLFPFLTEFPWTQVTSVDILPHRVEMLQCIAARQASFSITNSWGLFKLMSLKSVMLSSHLILTRPLLLLPPIPPSISP